MKKEAGKKIIEQKVEDFEKNSVVLKKKGHGETNIRSNYIDVFFEALGWNMKSHYDVVREFSQKDNSGTKKVDYAFKIKGKLKFFVEAKEASIDLVNDKGSIYQAKRYAYSTNGKAPVVILTDFEEFRVFNVLKAPDYNNTDRELMKKYSFEYTGYLENWDILWDTFSKEAVTAGSLDALRGKIDKNTKTMDVDFLEQISSWRETLAKTIALRNKELTVDELNEAVQRILDRLLFIRNLEDREIEPENTLLDKTKKAENIYKSLIPVFNNLDNVYNGLLFKKHFSEELVIDDKTIKDIIKSMCYPVSPFQFDVIEPEILGRIYEKFLGSKIRLTENHQAKVEEKMEVRKAGGVYYTPEYIVNYIVENTVGKKIESLNPEEIKKIKIVDPACGSGSFLLGAYSYLLDYHEKWYAKNKSDKAYKKDYYITKDGELKVNLDKRGAILRDNIFGVDIDKEATEVAIMSLYLKMLDDGFDKGERDLFFIKGHVLPDMTNNVKCGNSLIGTDYFDGKLEIDIEEMKEIKAFDWEKEFLRIFENGGFDCVIGNPPYVSAKSLVELFPREREYLSKSNIYKTLYQKWDLYIPFIEKGINILSGNGLISMIIPYPFINQMYAKLLREFIIKNHGLIEIVDLSGQKIFKDAIVTNCIFIISKSKSNNQIIISKGNENLINRICLKTHNDLIYDDNNSVWDLKIDEKLNKNFVGFKNLGDYCFISKGMVLNADEKQAKGKFIKEDLISDIETKIHIKRYIEAKNIARYTITKIRYLEWNTSRVPKLISRPTFPELYENPKLLVTKIGELKATFDSEKLYCDQTLRILVLWKYFKNIENNSINNSVKRYSNDNRLNLEFNSENISYSYLLGILNSKIGNYLLNQIRGVGNIDINPEYLKNIPIAPFDNEKHDSLVSLVEQMLQAQKDFRSTKSESDKKLYEQKIGMLDKKIDDLVYKLYGLTDDEIKIVEGGGQ